MMAVSLLPFAPNTEQKTGFTSGKHQILGKEYGQIASQMGCRKRSPG